MKPPDSPTFVRNRLQRGRRLHLWVAESDASEAIQWAQAEIELGLAEEYALGAATLEDVYIRLIGRHDALDDSVKRARHYGAIARDALGIFPESEEKSIFLDLIDFCNDRPY